MRFFTKELFEDWDEVNNGSRERFNEACELNYIEYTKAKERLPKKFTKIYEKTGHFDDAPVPFIGVITEYSNFTRSIKKGSSSALKMVIVDYDNRDLAWEIIISNIKEMTVNWTSDFSPLRIDCILHHELIVEDEEHISWEMLFSDGLDLKVVFKNISVKELKKDELEMYRHPVKVKKIKKTNNDN